VNPPVWIESDEARRPTRDDAAGGRAAAAAADGEAMLVGSCETEESGSPHSGQKRAESVAVDPHLRQVVKVRES